MTSYRARATILAVVLTTHAKLDLAVDPRVAGGTRAVVVAPICVDTSAAILTRRSTRAEVQI